MGQVIFWEIFGDPTTVECRKIDKLAVDHGSRRIWHREKLLPWLENGQNSSNVKTGGDADETIAVVKYLLECSTINPKLLFRVVDERSTFGNDFSTFLIRNGKIITVGVELYPPLFIDEPEHDLEDKRTNFEEKIDAVLDKFLKNRKEKRIKEIQEKKERRIKEMYEKIKNLKDQNLITIKIKLTQNNFDNLDNKKFRYWLNENVYQSLSGLIYSLENDPESNLLKQYSDAELNKTMEVKLPSEFIKKVKADSKKYYKKLGKDSAFTYFLNSALENHHFK
jgi:hypothetical protein